MAGELLWPWTLAAAWSQCKDRGSRRRGGGWSPTLMSQPEADLEAAERAPEGGRGPPPGPIIALLWLSMGQERALGKQNKGTGSQRHAARHTPPARQAGRWPRTLQTEGELPQGPELPGQRVSEQRPEEAECQGGRYQGPQPPCPRRQPPCGHRGARSAGVRGQRGHVRRMRLTCRSLRVSISSLQSEFTLKVQSARTMGFVPVF